MDNLPPPASPASELEQNPPEKQQLKSEVEYAKEEAAKLQRSASEQAGATLETVKSTITQVAQDAAGYGENIFDEQKGRLAEMVNEYGQATKAASERLHQEGHDALASRADEMALRLDRASKYLRETNLSGIYDDAQHFTRRRTELVFGMMFAAGLVAARFLKASDRGRTIERSLNVQSEEAFSDASSVSKVAPGSERHIS
jgi:gas vesicle protein